MLFYYKILEKLAKEENELVVHGTSLHPSLKNSEVEAVEEKKPSEEVALKHEESNHEITNEKEKSSALILRETLNEHDNEHADNTIFDQPSSEELHVEDKEISQILETTTNSQIVEDNRSEAESRINADQDKYLLNAEYVEDHTNQEAINKRDSEEETEEVHVPESSKALDDHPKVTQENSERDESHEHDNADQAIVEKSDDDDRSVHSDHSEEHLTDHMIGHHHIQVSRHEDSEGFVPCH
jgi:hypothetical protein